MPTAERYDLAVVGGGILGLACALAAARLETSWRLAAPTLLLR